MDILSANKSMAGGGGGVIIHIIDTGVNPVPELKPVLSVIPFLSGKTAQDGGTSSGGGLSGGNPDPYAAYDYYDNIGHGTMMAVCAHRQAPDAQIYSYCALPDSVRAYVNEALTYIADHLDRSKKHIVSMSFRGQGDLTDAYLTAMHNAIKRLVSMGMACAVNDVIRLQLKRVTSYVYCDVFIVSILAANVQTAINDVITIAAV